MNKTAIKKQISKVKQAALTLHDEATSLEIMLGEVSTSPTSRAKKRRGLDLVDVASLTDRRIKNVSNK